MSAKALQGPATTVLEWSAQVSAPTAELWNVNGDEHEHQSAWTDEASDAWQGDADRVTVEIRFTPWLGTKDAHEAWRLMRWTSWMARLLLRGTSRVYQ